MLGRSFTPKYAVNVTATTHEVSRAIQTTQKRFLQYSPAPDCAKPTGIRPIIVTSVPASIGAAVIYSTQEGREDQMLKTLDWNLATRGLRLKDGSLQ
jgi:hypothetical protein